MKNTKIQWPQLVALAVLSFVGTSCNQSGKEAGQQEEQPKVTAPSQIIEMDEAKSMYDNYTKRRLPLIQRYEDSINRSLIGEKIEQTQQKSKEDNNTKPFDVARFISYDYKTIKQYMDYIEQEADAAGVEISTLRIYFSNYPDEKGTKKELKHPRQNSVMLSPTLKKGKRNYLFYVAPGANGQEAVLMNDSFGTPKGMGLLPSKDTRSHASLIPNFFISTAKPLYAGSSLTLNRGHGSPPNDN